MAISKRIMLQQPPISAPIADVVLLEVLLGEVLQVALGHGDIGSDGHLGLLALDLDVVTKLANL